MPVFTALTMFVTTGLTAIGLPTAVAGIGANLIIGTGLSFVSQLLAGQPRIATPKSTAVLNQAVGERLSGWSSKRIGGTRAFFDSKSGELDQIIMVHHGLISGVEKYWIGDTEVEVDADGWVQTRPWLRSSGSKVQILSRLGETGSAPYQEMITRWPGVWTSAHQLRGIATLYAHFGEIGADNFNELFPQSHATSIRATCKLRSVYDPRTGITEWSDNAALCLLDYLTSPDGYRLSLNRMDLPSWSAFANVCDELVEKAAGGMERRYRIAGMYSLQSPPRDVLLALRLACDAQFFTTAEGKIGVHGGKWVEPEVTIEDAHILSYQLSHGAEKMASFNELQIQYGNGDDEAEAPRWKNTADQALRGPVQSQVVYEFCPAATQAQRLAKIFERRANPDWLGTIVTDLAGLRLIDQRTFRLKIPDGLSIDETFEVTSFDLASDLKSCSIGVAALSADAYAWNASEEGEATDPPADTRPDMTLPVPVFDLSTEVREFTAASSAPVVIALATASDRSLTLEAEVRLFPAGSFEGMTVSGLRATSGPLSEGQTYAVRARWRAALQVVGEWSAESMIDAGSVVASDAANDVFSFMPNSLAQSIKDETATDADADEITAAVQDAFDSQTAVIFPAGIYYLNAQITASGPRNIVGMGMGVSRLRWTQDAVTSGLEIVAGDETRTTTIDDISLETLNLGEGTALIVDYSSLIEGGFIVPRARTHVKASRVLIEGATGYTVDGWANGIELISCLGGSIDNCRINGYVPGAYGTMPVSGTGIWFHGAGSPVQLVVDGTFVSAFQVGLLAQDAEGTYISNCELVTVGIGVKVDNATLQPLLSLADSHVAAITKCVELTNCAEWTVSECVLYPVSPQVGDFIGVHVLAGCVRGRVAKNYFNRPNATTLYRAVVEDGGEYTQVVNNTFNLGSVSGCIGVDIGAAAVNTDVGHNVYDTAHTRVLDASDTATFEEFRSYAGSLDDIVTSPLRSVQTHILVSGVTGGKPPSLVSTTACVVCTESFDANTAVQTLRTPAASREYYRRKAAGAWSVWSFVDYTADP